MSVLLCCYSSGIFAVGLGHFLEKTAVPVLFSIFLVDASVCYQRNVIGVGDGSDNEWSGGPMHAACTEESN